MNCIYGCSNNNLKEGYIDCLLLIFSLVSNISDLLLESAGKCQKYRKNHYSMPRNGSLYLHVSSSRITVFSIINFELFRGYAKRIRSISRSLDRLSRLSVQLSPLCRFSDDAFRKRGDASRVSHRVDHRYCSECIDTRNNVPTRDRVLAAPSRSSRPARVSSPRRGARCPTFGTRGCPTFPPVSGSGYI